MTLKTSVKGIVSPFVPNLVRNQILRRYYLGKVRTYRRQGWNTCESDLQVVRHLVHAGDDVVDVGANFGFYTAYLSERVGPGGSVSSFEPIPRTFDLLAYCARKLPLSNVRLFNCAVSDRECTATMAIPTFEAGDENYYQARLARAEGANSSQRQLLVDVKRLDFLLAGRVARLAFIKVDVEGHELHAIRGAKSLIHASHPSLLIEMSGDLDDPASEGAALVRELVQEGYSPYWYDGNELRRRAAGDSSINYFFLTPAQVRQLATRVRCATT